MPGFLSNLVSKLTGLDRTDIKKYEPKSMTIKGPYNKAQKIQTDFDNAVAFEETNREWSDRNWLMYSGFNDGQWDDEAVAKLKAQGRHIGTYNFVRAKVDGLAGSLLKNWFDLDFVPVDGSYSELTQVMKDLFYSDKELMNWKAAYYDLVIDGLVYRAVGQLSINDRYNALGNIALERCMPGHVIIDPHWISNSSRDIKKLWKVCYMTPGEIMNLYKHKTDEIQSQIEFMAQAGASFDLGDDERGFPHYDLDRIYATKYRVVEQHHLQTESKLIEIDVKTGTIIPEGTDDKKREFCIRNGLDCSDGVIERPYDVNVYYVSTICPQLDPSGLVEDRQHEIQIGCLPFYVWSAARINGKSSGIVDLLYDVQQTINKRESLIDHIIATQASGATAIDPQLVGDDPYARTELSKNWNNPSYRFWSAPGAIASGRKYFEELPKAQYPNDVQQELDRMINYMDRLGKQPAVSDARNDSAHETGILYARKQLQADITQTVLTAGLERWWNEIGEGYLLIGKPLYSDSYREFTKADGKTKFSINEKVDTPWGPYTNNNLALLPRHKVIVSQSPEGVTIRATNRAINAELLRSVPESNLASRAMLTKQIMGSLDHMADSDRQRLKDMSDLELQLSVETLKTNILGMKFQQQQIQAQMQQVGQPQLPTGTGSPAPPQDAPPQEQPPTPERKVPRGHEIPLQ